MNCNLGFSLVKGLFVGWLLLGTALADGPGVQPPPPPQDKGIPYTRSAEPMALAKIKDGFAVFAGSRYGYAKGFRVRLSDTDLLRAEAVMQDGIVYVPGAFAAVLELPAIQPEPLPADLAILNDRWVYAPEELPPGAGSSPKKLSFTPSAGVKTIQVKGETYYSIADVAKAKGLHVTQFPNGLIYMGPADLTFADNESVIKDSVTCLFDTPDKLADPDLATKYIPTLAREGKWTDYVKVTPAQLAMLNGPATDWPTAPKADYDLTGFNKNLLGSKVPPPGVYPRLLFSPEDVPAVAARIKNSKIGQMNLIETGYLLKKDWWNPATSDGAIFQKLATGQLDGLNFDVPAGEPDIAAGQTFVGEKPGVYNSHVAYVPECLTAMAFYCLITGDEEHGKQAAAAISNFYKLREKILDEWLAMSDSEFATTYTDDKGNTMVTNGMGAKTHWRNIHGFIAHMNLALSLDFAGKWMTPEQKHVMQRVIAKVTYGRRSYAQDNTVRFRDVNWMGWDLTHFLAVTELEGLPGFDPEGYASGMESVRAFCDWGIDDNGVVYESDGKTPGSFHFIVLSMMAQARRGENLFGHPHWRKLLMGQVQMTSPSGKVTVNSGTVYAPWSRQMLSLNLITELQGLYSNNRWADYLITKAIDVPGADKDSGLREYPRDGFTPEQYEETVATLPRLRLPSPSYPGMAHDFIYDGDMTKTTRADLNLPLDFDAPFQGVFSSYSDRSTDAAWINLYVRPHHYLGAGHHHADAGQFHFSALGVDWFTQSPFSSFDGTYVDTVQVDGKSEPTSIRGGPGGYNGAATYFGAKIAPMAATASADLTYSYSWRWMTQPPQVWSDELKAMNWELDPSPNITQIFAGTARFKMRPWWTNYTYTNYIPTSRAAYNPMQYVYRTTGLVRGDHPYGFVLDDLKKDGSSHTYSWIAMLSGGVWKAAVPGLSGNQLALAYTGIDPNLYSSDTKPDIAPKPGDPVLLVDVEGVDSPKVEVATIPGDKDRQGKTEYYDRLNVDIKDPSVNFRVLLLPYKFGDPLPKVAYDNASQTATITYPGQTDSLTFTSSDKAPESVIIKRGGEVINKQ